MLVQFQVAQINSDIRMAFEVDCNELYGALRSGMSVEVNYNSDLYAAVKIMMRGYGGKIAVFSKNVMLNAFGSCHKLVGALIEFSDMFDQMQQRSPLIKMAQEVLKKEAAHAELVKKRNREEGALERKRVAESGSKAGINNSMMNRLLKKGL